MAKFCGKLLLLLKGNLDGPPETFTQVGGVVANGFTLGKEMVDITSKDDLDFRQALEACGLRTMSISLSGKVTDEVKFSEIIVDFFASLHKNYQITSQSGESFEGKFEIASYERTGEKTTSEDFSITLESAGDIVYTPAP